MEEIWKDIKGFEGLYQISNYGRVKSLERIIVKKNNLMQFIPQNIRINILIKGYYRVVFCKKGIKINMPVHRLVSMEFIPNPENKPFVNHKDGNKLNNCVENLEWCTSSENTIHAYNNNLTNSHSENHHSAKLKNIDIPKIIELHKNGTKQTEIALIFNISTSVINSIIKKRKWNHVIL